jgi:ubiquinone/menaquinone biosynthesis C-methylase UbiE
MRRDFSASELELMDLPQQEEEALRRDLQQIAGLNRTFGARKIVARLFHRLTAGMGRITLIDLAAGYGDHARNLIAQGAERGQEVRVVAVDFNRTTLQIAREATGPGAKMFFVQADARRLPFRDRGADLVFCSLALHHFSGEDAVRVLREMRRAARFGAACIDLARSRLAQCAIGLLTTFIIRDPMVRHDARLSCRRAFSAGELKAMAQRAGWPGLAHRGFFWFQQAVTGWFEPGVEKVPATSVAPVVGLGFASLPEPVPQLIPRQARDEGKD